MSNRLDLRGALTKFEWAKKHARELQRDVVCWAYLDTERPVILRREFDSKRGYADFWVESVRDPPHRWGLMLGDALNNFRGALDYLACELVRTGHQPEKKDETTVFFPLSEKHFRHFIEGPCRNHLPGVPLGRCRVLSPFQPYAGRPWDHPGKTLLRLFRLSGREKHRELAVTVLRPYVYEFRSPRGRRAHITGPNLGQPLEAGTKAVSIPVGLIRPDLKPNVQVDFDATFQIAIQDGPYLMPFLRQAELLVAEVLGKFL